MEKYIPLALAIFLILVGISVEHSILYANVPPAAQVPWMTNGLAAFLFIIWAIGMFVIIIIYKTFSQRP